MVCFTVPRTQRRRRSPLQRKQEVYSVKDVGKCVLLHHNSDTEMKKVPSSAKTRGVLGQGRGEVWPTSPYPRTQRRRRSPLRRKQEVYSVKDVGKCGLLHHNSDTEMKKVPSSAKTRGVLGQGRGEVWATSPYLGHRDGEGPFFSENKR